MKGMPAFERVVDALAQLQDVELQRDVLLSQYTRFAIGGPAKLLIDVRSESALFPALALIRASGVPHAVIGQGTNLVVADAGFPGIVLRYTASEILVEGRRIKVQAGALLQQLVDTSIEHGLEGLHTMTGIPGWVGAAIYGNAGAYGHSISEFVVSVRFSDGAALQEMDNAACEFAYRESIFKRRKEWVVVSALLELPCGDRDALRRQAAEILATRNAKYPPSMKCAGSIFKNLLLASLPAEVQAQVPAGVIREGKVPAAWFLEQVGAKGMRCGAIAVASYHANLIYNTNGGQAAELRSLIHELKHRVRERFGLTLEEEVQYLGFGEADSCGSC